MKQYWANKKDEEQAIKEASFISELIQLKEMWKEGIKSKLVNPFEEEVFYYPKKKLSKSKGKKAPTKTKGAFRKAIDEKIKISEVAKIFGLKVKRNKIVCPFHNDTDPSLSLNDDLNTFHCFGCHAKGDIIEFYRRLYR